MMPPWRSRARWWLTAGWLWLSSEQSAPTCFSPSDRIMITCRRVGSLTCLSRIEARRACCTRCSEPLVAFALTDALAAVVVLLGLVLVAVILADLLSCDHGPIGRVPPPLVRPACIATRRWVAGPDDAVAARRGVPASWPWPRADRCRTRGRDDFKACSAPMYHNLGG